MNGCLARTRFVLMTTRCDWAFLNHSPLSFQISVILGKKTLYLYHLPEPDSPAELGFQHKYGSLIQHKWFGDGYILLGFSQGHVVAISTHPKEVGQELWQIKNHRDSLTSIAVSSVLEQVASCGDNR